MFISADVIVSDWTGLVFMHGTFKFIHCADLHLGSSFHGLSESDEDLGKRLRESMFEALDNIVAIAREEDVDFVIFSGDIFDDTEETLLTRSRFVSAIKKIDKNCYICYGNHDDRRKWEKSLPLPKNAFVFSKTVEEYTFSKNDADVARIIGASFSNQTTEDLIADIAGAKDIFNIGVFHCNLDSYSQDDVYAPCKKDSLLKKGIDYWALGHIHKRRIVSERPYIVYPGNTQGKKITELGIKGCYVVTVTDGSVSSIDFHRTGNFAFEDVVIDITDKNNFLDAIDVCCSNLDDKSILKITISGRGVLDNELRTDGEDSVKKTIEERTGHTVASLSFSSMPDIDLDLREKTGDFLSEVIKCGKKLSGVSRDSLLDKICSTKLSKSIKSEFEIFDDKQLKKMITDARNRIVWALLQGR
ncbi:MAG: DNA repair exonuclease [archaeon]|nr:DNA repair exonuclease [archaeon]